MPVTAVIAAFVPSPQPTVDPDLVTPGPLGFAAMALIAVAVFLLVFDMLRRVRRTRYRAEVAEALDAEEAARREQEDQDGQSEQGGQDGQQEGSTRER